MSDEMPEIRDPPDGWTLATVRSVVDLLQYGISTKADANAGTGVPILRMGNIQEGRLDVSDLKYVTRSRDLAAVRLAAGDILFNRTNSPDLVGKAAVVDVGDEMVFASYLIRLRARTSTVYPRYLCWWINSAWGREWAARVRTDGVSQSNINGTKLGEMPVPLAPLAEQARIVEKGEALLEQVNRAKERLDRVPLILKRFRQAVLAAACSGELTSEWRKRHETVSAPTELITGAPSNELPPADEHLDGEDFPDTWARCRVDALVGIQNGRAFPSKQYLKAGGVRLIRPGNLDVSGRVEWTAENTVTLPFTWAREFPEFVLGQGELLMNLTAQSLKDEFLGRVCIKLDAEPALLNQRIARFRNLGPVDVRPYLLVYFKSKFFRSFVSGLDTGSLIRHMHSKDVARHVVPLPPREEQEEIVRSVASFMALAAAVERHCRSATAQADRLPQAILGKAFSGELVPTEADLAQTEGRAYETAEELLARVRRTTDDGPARARRGRTDRREMT